MASLPNNISNLKTITINAGDSAFLPRNAVVLALSSSGDAFPSSECIDLSNVGSYGCFEIQWVSEVDEGGGTGPWDSNDRGSSTIASMSIGSTTIDLNTDMSGRIAPLIMFDDVPYTNIGLIDKIKTATGELFQGLTFKRLELSGERKLHVLYFKAPAVLEGQISMKFQVYNNTAFLTGQMIASDRCETDTV